MPYYTAIFNDWAYGYNHIDVAQICPGGIDWQFLNSDNFALMLIRRIQARTSFIATDTPSRSLDGSGSDYTNNDIIIARSDAEIERERAKARRRRIACNAGRI